VISSRAKDIFMAEKNLILDFAEYSLDRLIADRHAIRRHNPQRHEMEQLTAVVFEDTERKICVGYKDVGHDEFWVRGHLPERPLMPGIVICEVAAQLSSYFCQSHDYLGCDLLGFGGMDEVRFRGSVVPGDRLAMVVQALKMRPRLLVQSRFQGFVRESLVVEGKMTGVAIQLDRDTIPMRRPEAQFPTQQHHNSARAA
jgi:3-hydroxyacyl-[acyl-carrier-protein] dehydratase